MAACHCLLRFMCACSGWACPLWQKLGEWWEEMIAEKVVSYHKSIIDWHSHLLSVTALRGMFKLNWVTLSNPNHRLFTIKISPSSLPPAEPRTPKLVSFGAAGKGINSLLWGETHGSHQQLGSFTGASNPPRQQETPTQQPRAATVSSRHHKSPQQQTADPAWVI